MERKKVVCAGHVCVDITPVISDKGKARVEEVLLPGKLLNVGRAEISLGGSVSNTGIGMKVLGNDVVLMGKIGEDSFGNMVYELYQSYGAEAGLIRQEGEETSYSVVLAIPGIDRIFLHNPGANDTFQESDIPWETIEDAALFHFGYPPLMKRIFQREGEELCRIMSRARGLGMATSLDLAAVDPDAESGKADWRAILARVLPHVDFFVPSVEELCFMLDPDRFADWKQRAGGRDVCDVITVEDIRPLADTCMDMGCRVLMIKCGAPGMYLRTEDRPGLEEIPERIGLNAEMWADQEFFEKSYRPDRILSGTGAGDTSIAAFLTAVLRGYGPDWAMRFATATGASCITQLDALSGLLSFEEMEKKIEAGWEKNS